MFANRQKESQLLNDEYSSDRFSFSVLYNATTCQEDF